MSDEFHAPVKGVSVSISSHLATRSRLATVTRRGDPEEIRLARADHAAAMLARAVRTYAPEIRGDDRVTLARLLVEGPAEFLK